MKIETLIANPAAGKTDAILSHVLENNEKAIIASPSRILSEQSYSKFKRMGGRAVIIDSSQRLSLKTVSASLTKVVKEEVPVIFITHAGLSNIESTSLFRDYSLYIDEVPNLVDFKEFPLKSNLSIVTKFCEPIEEKSKDPQVLKLLDSEVDSIKEKMKDGYDGNDMIDDVLYELYEALLDPRIYVMVKHTQGDIANGSKVFFLNDTKKRGWEDFKKVTIACSNLFETFTGKFLTHYHQCEFVPSELEKRLRFKHYKNTNRVKIHVMTDLYKWSRYKSNNNNAFQRMVDYVTGLCGDNFIYTVNKARESYMDGLGEKIPYGAQGLNKYVHYSNVAVLFSFNPRCWEVEVLQGLAKVCGLSVNEFVDARHFSDYLEPAFQLCLRCNLRDNESEKEVNLFVPDLILAEYLKRYLPNATIVTDGMISTEVKRKICFANMFEMTKQEAVRFRQFKSRMKKAGQELSPHDKRSIEIVRMWIEKQRQYQPESPK